jgi:predicted branched-subunit amino acid permease
MNVTTATVDARRLGLHDGIGTALALAPLGLVVGTLTAEAMSSAGAWVSGPLLVSGAAQLALVSLASSGASAVAVLVTVVLLTSRCAVYGAALSSRFVEQPRWFRWLGAYLLIDQIYVLVDSRRDELHDPVDFRHYYLAAMTPIYANWLVGTGLGVVLGQALPETWRLELAFVVLIAVMLRGALVSRSAWIGAAVAGVTTLLVAPVASGGALVIGIAAGIVARRLA